MRILFLSTWYPYPPDNGSKLRVYHLLRALAGSHEVVLVSFAFGSACLRDAARLGCSCVEVHAVLMDPFCVNRETTLQAFLSSSPVTSRVIPEMQSLVSGLFALQSFDVVIASTEVMAPYMNAAPESVPRILEEHNSMVRWARERYENEVIPLRRARCWASWRKRLWYDAHTFPRYSLVTMVSELDRVAALDAVGESRVRVEVVPNGVDCKHNTWCLARPRPNSLVYNGALTYSANYDAMQWFLAEIYPLLQAQIPSISLTITGSTANVDLAGLDLDSSVTLSGYVDDVRLLVAGAEVCVVPIREGGGTRLKILEAMALGTPVVATIKGAEGLDLVDGEHVLLRDTPGNFAAAVARVLGDSVLRRHLERSARALVEQQYDWEMIGARFVDLVEDTVAGVSCTGGRGGVLLV